jgi:hypothetical protein
MHGEIKDWNNGWYGISLGLSAAEIDHLIGLLTNIRNDPEQHFHISSDYVGTEGVGDIEVYVSEPSGASNMRLGGLALAPGDSVA